MNDSKKRKHQETREDDVIWEDFGELARRYPEFRQAYSKLQHKSISAGQTPEFQVALTRALIHSRFNLTLPSLPLDRLSPPVPNRWSYVRWISQKLLPMLQSQNSYFATTATPCHRGMDIGTGASAIYPLLMIRDSPHFSMVATEIDPVSAESALTNVRANDLSQQIQILHVRPTRVQEGLETSDPPMNGTVDTFRSGGPIACAMEKLVSASSVPRFDFVMTNPPFFDKEEALAPRADDRERSAMTECEGMYPGGEEGFIMDMIRDSLVWRENIGWYTAMCGKKASFVRLKTILTHLLGPGHLQTMEFGPGHMTRWFLAWTFHRPCIRSPVVVGKQDPFAVSTDGLSPDAAILNVVDRICVYCKSSPGGWKLTAQVSFMRTGGMRVEIRESNPQMRTATHVDDSASLPDRLSIGLEHNWDARSFMPEEGHFLIDATVEKSASVFPWTVMVGLKFFRHSSRGMQAVETIRAQIQGEISRTNRRWRRILKRQAEASATENDAAMQE